MYLTLSRKIIIVLLFSSVLPLVIFAALSSYSIRKSTFELAKERHRQISLRAAQEIESYFDYQYNILLTLSQNLKLKDLNESQKQALLLNYLNRFPEIRKIEIWKEEGLRIDENNVLQKELSEAESLFFNQTFSKESFWSEVYFYTDLSPNIRLGIRIPGLNHEKQILVADLNLQNLWKMMDEIHLGAEGVMHLLDDHHVLLASGSGKHKEKILEKKEFLTQEDFNKLEHGQSVVAQMSFSSQSLWTLYEIKRSLNWFVLVEEPLSQIYFISYRIIWLMIGLLFFLIAAAIAMGAYGGRKEVVHPIRKLIEATEELAKGNLNFRLFHNRKDEFGYLNNSFNRMMEDLQNLQNRLLAEERQAVFGRVASGLAHDLKHPINAIEMASKLMDVNYEDPEFRKTFKEIVNREFSKIRHFLEGLKTLVKELPYQPVECLVKTLIQEVLHTFELRMKSQKVNYEIKLNPENLKIKIDRMSFPRALSNLISNALDAMPKGGALAVGVEENMNQVIFSIRDTGCGMSQEKMKTIFEEFASSNKKGLGLGINITQKIVKMHGGTLELESKEGEGTEFRIVLAN